MRALFLLLVFALPLATADPSVSLELRDASCEDHGDLAWSSSTTPDGTTRTTRDDTRGQSCEGDGMVLLVSVGGSSVSASDGNASARERATHEKWAFTGSELASEGAWDERSGAEHATRVEVVAAGHEAGFADGCESSEESRGAWTGGGWSEGPAYDYEDSGTFTDGSREHCHRTVTAAGREAGTDSRCASQGEGSFGSRYASDGRPGADTWAYTEERDDSDACRSATGTEGAAYVTERSCQRSSSRTDRDSGFAWEHASEESETCTSFTGLEADDVRAGRERGSASETRCTSMGCEKRTLYSDWLVVEHPTLGRYAVPLP